MKIENKIPKLKWLFKSLFSPHPFLTNILKKKNEKEKSCHYVIIVFIFCVRFHQTPDKFGNITTSYRDILDSLNFQVAY